MNTSFAVLHDHIEEHLRERFQQLDAQLYRLEQSQLRIDELASDQRDQAQRRWAMARKEQDILRKNLDLLKSRCRSDGVKQILALLVPYKQRVEDLSSQDWSAANKAFSTLYVGKTAAQEEESKILEPLLELIWQHFKALEGAEAEPVNLQAENDFMKSFRQQRFHPFEKIALTQLHGILAQMRAMQPRSQAASSSPTGADTPTQAPKAEDPKLRAPEQQADLLQQEINTLQRQLYQMRSRLRLRLGEGERQRTLDSLQSLESKQDKLYSALRQWLIWHCLEQLQQYGVRFDTLGEQLDKALDLSHSLSIGERAAYVKQVLNKDLYQLYLDCRQTQIADKPLKTLDYIDNQKGKVARLGLDDFQQHFQQLLSRDEALILSLQERSESILPAETEYLSALRPPLHRIIERLEALNLSA